MTRKGKIEYVERKTAHQMRVEQVRARVQRVLAKIEPQVRRGGFTRSGAFAERVWKIAQERGITVSKAVDILTTGVPKDLTTGVNNFANGKYGAHEARLDVYELACIEFETEERERRAEARSQLRVVPSTPEAPEAVSGPEEAAEEVVAQESEPSFNNPKMQMAQMFAGLPPMDEFEGARQVNNILTNFDGPTAKRILSYVQTARAAREES